MNANQEQAAAFDRAVKRRLMEGEDPEDAVPNAAGEVGLKLEPERTQAIVRVLQMALLAQKDPDFHKKTQALTRRIHELVRQQGLSIQKAVLQAQEDTGVHLGEQGQKVLIETLEKESERLSQMSVEVVSDEEFQRMQHTQLCVQVNQPPAWLCCACNKGGRATVNPLDRTTCRACNHRRCDVQ